MNPIRLHHSLILDTSDRQDPDFVVKQFLEEAGFADKEKSVEVIRGDSVVCYTLDGPETLTELRRAQSHGQALVLRSDQSRSPQPDRPTDFTIENARPFAHIWHRGPLKFNITASYFSQPLVHQAGR